MRAKDINCRSLSVSVKLLEDDGVDVSSLCDDLPVTLDEIRDPRCWLDWPTAAVIIERHQQLAGGPEGMRAIGVREVPDMTNRFYAQLMKTIVNPTQLYRLVVKVIAPAVCPYHEARLIIVNQRHLQVELSLPPEGPGSTGFFHNAAGTFIALPTLLDMPQASVDASIRDHRADFDIYIPSSMTLWARVRRRFARGSADAALEELERQQRELAENHQELRRAYDTLKAREENLTREIAERERIQQVLDAQDIQLRQAQKMDAMGKLSGGIAHDFNNHLTVILGYAELISQASDLESAQRFAGMIRQSAQASSSLTRQLLAFARRQMLKPRIIDLNELVARMDDMLRRTLGENIDLDVVRGGGLGKVRADRGQLEQALLNLTLNARDAMGEQGGHVTIETANVYLDRSYVRDHPDADPGRYVLLAVSDDGPGIAADQIGYVFEPFFTTKTTGTGLGLSMVQGFVVQSGGLINVYSEDGVGTTLKIYLPRVEQEAGTAGDPWDDEIVSEKVMGTEAVLVVEDEPLLCNLVTRILERHGYTVVAAADGAEALEKVESFTPDIVLTDVVMPGMNGAEVVARLRERFHGLPALYMSGYTENAIVHRGELDPGIVLIQKPFTMREILTVVRGALDKDAG